MVIKSFYLIKSICLKNLMRLVYLFLLDTLQFVFTIHFVMYVILFMFHAHNYYAFENTVPTQQCWEEGPWFTPWSHSNPAVSNLLSVCDHFSHSLERCVHKWTERVQMPSPSPYQATKELLGQSLVMLSFGIWSAALHTNTCTYRLLHT